MSLIAFCGDLGAGKTLSLTFFAMKNFMKGRTIYANYHLKQLKIPEVSSQVMFKPYHFIDSVDRIDKMKEGFFAGDELWLWLDSRESLKKKNKVISAILAKSRKRGMDIGFTAQGFHQIDRRIRGVCDFIAQPVLVGNNKWCILYIFDRYDLSRPISVKKFQTWPVFKLYDHREEISILD